MKKLKFKPVSMDISGIRVDVCEKSVLIDHNITLYPFPTDLESLQALGMALQRAYDHGRENAFREIRHHKNAIERLVGK